MTFALLWQLASSISLCILITGAVRVSTTVCCLVPKPHTTRSYMIVLELAYYQHLDLE